ncbi:hypothetical protein FIBSPDRAFT_951794 [Athelia psychrophila]|uniref:Uncharacterized protein n=1 Tax=Athelia psychrophila TaxID=1759441 RepID=A0A166M2D5_9AGAM|nr:hypothetical protein FIBSPDRAFT_951794 [Fibularhizoctonia sp. CBS 109695]
MSSGFLSAKRLPELHVPHVRRVPPLQQCHRVRPCLLRAILASLPIAVTCILLSLVRYVRVPEDIDSSAPSQFAT